MSLQDLNHFNSLICVYFSMSLAEVSFRWAAVASGACGAFATSCFNGHPHRGREARGGRGWKGWERRAHAWACYPLHKQVKRHRKMVWLDGSFSFSDLFTQRKLNCFRRVSWLDTHFFLRLSRGEGRLSRVISSQSVSAVSDNRCFFLTVRSCSVKIF